MSQRKTRGPHYSGQHTSTRRRITLTDEQVALQDAVARAHDQSWAAWAAMVLEEHAELVRDCIEEEDYE